VVDPDGTRTRYGALARRSMAAAAGLKAQIVGAGRTRAPTVVFLVEPGARYVETLLATWRAGAIAVPLSPVHTAPELAYVIQDAAPVVLVASKTQAHRLADLRAPLRCLVADDLVSMPA